MAENLGNLKNSINDLHGIVPVKRRGWLRRLFAFVGPAYLVSVGYMDPGNWATDIEGGARFGYTLIWVLLMSNLILAKAGLPLLVLACLSFVPAAATGFLRASSMGSDPEFRELMVPHRNMNIAAGVICLAALALRLRRNRPAVKPGWPYLLLVGAAAVLVFAAGHLGGKMVFGSNYLPF